ncbi:DUF2800 domain-containing protein, partial [Candidatus Pacearchaeota archaeon]|nr:DUF2800 domain-containing protein [Candidatus Pacearchaeota archaeon]
MGHSRIAPSGMPRTVPCPGSVVMQERYPETEDSLSAKEGNASHWAAACILEGKEPVTGQSAPNGVILTADMIDYARVYTHDILTTMPPDTLNIEAKVTAAERIHPESWGSVDSWAYDPKARILYVWDYKYGFGIVEPFENWQLINYTVGIMEGLRIRDDQITVRMTIAQPRAPHPQGPIRRWVVKGTDLRPYANQLHAAAHEALGPDPSVKSGSHCRDCRARHACPSANGAALLAIDVAYRAEPYELDDAAIGSQLTILKRAQAAIGNRLTALETQAESKIRAGGMIPGWSMEQGAAGKLAWTKSEAEVLALGELLGVPLGKPMTPTQAKKVGIPDDLIDVYASRSPGSLKLTKAST